MLKEQNLEEFHRSSRNLVMGFQKNFLEPISKSINQSRLEKPIENCIEQEISQPIIKQIQRIEEVKETNQILQDEILAETRQQNQNDKQSLLQLSKLQEEGETMTKKIEQQQLLKKELQKEIELAQNCIEQKKQSLNNESGTELPHLTKKMKNQEHQLEKKRRQHNEALSEILQLKDQVSVARRERVIFDQVFKKLEMDLNKNEEQIKEDIFNTIQAEKQSFRDQVKEELYKLKQLAYKEDNTYQSTVKINSPSSRTTKNKRKLQEQQITEEQIQLAESEKELIYQFEQQRFLMQKMFVEANVQNFEEFIEMYKTLEGKNTENVKIAAHKLEELEQMQKENQELDKEIQTFSSLKLGLLENDNPKKFINLQEKLIALETKNFVESEINNNLQDEINYLKDNLKTLTHTIQCGQEKMLQIDENQEITQHNFLNYLELIDEKTNEIIDFTNFLQDNINLTKFNHYESLEGKEQKLALQDKKNIIVVSNLLENLEKQNEYDKLKTDDDFRIEGQLKIKEFMDQQLKLQQNSSIRIKQTRSKTKIVTMNSIHPNVS